MKSFLRARQPVLICLALAFGTIFVYWRVGGFRFLNYDDETIFFQNSIVRDGLTWRAILWGATTNFYEYWHPLMWWSHELDCQLFGMNAGPHHLVSLGFHVANTLLVFAVFRRMTGMVWRSAVVAALFALHPLHVESVAWLAERKDLLSTFFWLLNIWAYVRYVQREALNPVATDVSRRISSAERVSADSRLRLRIGHDRFYWLSLLFFLLGLLSKPMVVTLPFVLLLLDYWPLNRISMFNAKDEKQGPSWPGLLREKVPFFALTLIFCFTTWYSVKLGNHVQSSERFPLAERLANVPVSYALYLWKLIYPVNLAVLYPMPNHVPRGDVAIAIAELLFLSWLVFFRLRSARYLAFGWLLFLGTLVPTIGIVSVGAQSMADRYMYLPSIGLFAALVWAMADFSMRWRYRAIVLSGATAVILAICASTTWFQVQHWKDSVSLWSHCLASGADSLIARYNLGGALMAKGDNDAAVEQYLIAQLLDPKNPEANRNLGVALTAAGKAESATNYFIEALNAAPDYVEAHENYGFTLLELGDLEAAIAQFAEAIRLQPNRLDAYVGMGKALSAQGRSGEALDLYLRTVHAEPAFGLGHYSLGVEYLKHGKFDEGTQSLETAIRCDPDSVLPRMQLASAFSSAHKAVEAARQYQEVLHLNPNLIEALNNLAWLFATSPDVNARNGAEAVRLAERACAATDNKQTICVGTLAAAYAEAGQFDQAVQTAQKACDLATAHGETNLLTRNKALLAQYQSHQPYRETN